MRIYLSLSQVPELSRLSPKQRQFVWRHCVHPLTLTGRAWVVHYAVVFPFTMLAVLVAWPGAAAVPIAAGLAAGFASYVADMILVARFRPEIRQFVAEHETDIAAAAQKGM